MKKRNGIITLVILLAVLAGGIYTSIFGLDSAGSGSAANIKQGLDLAGGTAADIVGGGGGNAVCCGA